MVEHLLCMYEGLGSIPGILSQGVYVVGAVKDLCERLSETMEIHCRIRTDFFDLDRSVVLQ